jgi:hypothetical protein
MIQPKPSDYKNHTHSMFIYYKTIDTLMSKDDDSVIKAEFNFQQYEYSRPPQPYNFFELSTYDVSFPNNVKINLIRGDSSTKICTTTIRHFTDYQKQYGGDTMHFAQLDSIADWHASIIASDGSALLSDSTILPLHCYFNLRIPDSVINPYRIKMEFLWQGLFGGDTSYMYLQANHITVSQLSGH